MGERQAIDRTIWKSDWAAARSALEAWWQRKGLALSVTAPKDEPWARVEPVPADVGLETKWLDADYRVRRGLYHMAGTYYGGVAFPQADTNIGGPGTLGLLLGWCEGRLAPETVWYDPKIVDPESTPTLKLDRTNPWWGHHMRMIDTALAMSRGRYLVSMPDLIENIDTLAQLRDPQTLLIDLVERPGWVKEKIWEINAAFFECFDAFREKLVDEQGGNVFAAFSLWGPGRTAKVQCDISCAISAAMFREFVVPPLAEQCAWLDWSMFHLDGTQAMHHLDALLAIDALDAIEWTPQAGIEGGGHRRWYDLYRRIKAAGKSVQAVGVRFEEVEPLIDAVGAEGMYIMTSARSETQARDLLQRVGWQHG